MLLSDPEVLNLCAPWDTLVVLAGNTAVSAMGELHFLRIQCLGGLLPMGEAGERKAPFVLEHSSQPQKVNSLDTANSTGYELKRRITDRLFMRQLTH